MCLSKAPFFSPVLLTIGLLLSACDPSPVNVTGTDAGTGTTKSSQVKVGRLAASHQLLDGGFESGLASWYGCSNYEPSSNADSTAGQSVLLPAQSCIYQTVQADEQNSYELSCQTKRVGDGWAALTLAYLDEQYRTLHQEEVQIRNGQYQQTMLTLNAMQNATYVEVLAYTNSAQLLLDECSLESNAAHPGVLSNPLPDGSFPLLTEMEALQSFSVDSQDTMSTDIDWRQAWIAHNDNGVFIAWETYEKFASHIWGHGVYLDTDQNRNTGFRGFYDEFPIGVDYLVEGVEQFRYTGNGTDWSWELTRTGGSDVQYIEWIDIGNLDTINLFFKADSTSVGGRSNDYYPDAVTDNTAGNATRYFTYDTSGTDVTLPNPPVVTPPVVTPPPIVTPPSPPVETPLARLDVRTNLEGHENWSVADASNFPTQIVTKNNGNQTLTNVIVSVSLGDGCEYSYPSLEPGETKQEICRTPEGNSHYQHALASATAPDGEVVRDDDSTSIETVAFVSRNLLSVTPDKPIATISDTVTLDIQVASSGAEAENRVTGINSSVPACSRVFSQPVALGSIEAYECSVAIDQLPLTASFEAVSDNSTVVENITIVEAGVATLTLQSFFSSSFTDLFRTSVRVGNIGAVAVSDLNIRGRSATCTHSIITTPVTDLATGDYTGSYNCYGVLDERGGAADTALIVTGTTPDGQTFETVLESAYTTRRDTNNLVLSLADSNSNVISGAANEAVTVNFELRNQGYYEVGNISLEDFTSYTLHPEYQRSLRFNPNQVIPPEVSVENCAAVANATISAPAFTLAPGAAVEFQCSITMPVSNIYMGATAKYEPTAIVGNTDFDSASLGYFRLVSDQPATNTTTLAGPYQPVVDMAIPNPVITPNRAIQLLQNPGFENVGTDGMPQRWVAGCEDGAVLTNGYYGKALGLPSLSCASYVLDSNELAQLSGHKYTLGCEITDHSRSIFSSQLYGSLSISLNGTQTTAELEYAQGYLTLSGVAPASVTEGYVSLYTNGVVEMDNCQLILTGTSSNSASIKVSNHFPGPDVYKSAGPMDFVVTVSNDGNTDLQNIEVSSSELSCDRNYASLLVGESKAFVCNTNKQAHAQWDQRVSHVITATADSAQGVVADSDFSGYGNLYIMDSTGLNVEVNSQQEDNITPVIIGSDVEIQVEFVQRSHESIVQVASSIPDCARKIETMMEPGDYVRYSCTLANVQSSTDVYIQPLVAGVEDSGVYFTGPGVFTIEVAP